jgi:signal transduction histidine kinase
LDVDSAAVASAQDVGTAAEAKAMLEKVIADMKANEAKTLQDINAGTYNKKDLYPFCGAANGTFNAHSASKSLVGQGRKDRKDASGKTYGEEFYKAAQSGKFSKYLTCSPSPAKRRQLPKVHI